MQTVKQLLEVYIEHRKRVEANIDESYRFLIGMRRLATQTAEFMEKRL
jgi:hypothetical protein